MQGIHKKIEDELNKLIEEGKKILEEFSKTEKIDTLLPYQTWYTRALPVITHLLPDRLEEFKFLYHGKTTKNVSPKDYGIADYILEYGTDIFNFELAGSFNTKTTIINKINIQISILESAQFRLDDILSNITGVLQAQLFDSEIEAAKELWKNGHYRAAGALAGVVLESHLSTVAKNHNVTVKKKEPHISDWNESLKQNNVIDVLIWRRIQGLADIRNLCTHKKSREPNKDEVLELIEGVEKITKALV